MNLPGLDTIDVNKKRVLVRLDLDTKIDLNDLRIKSSEKTLNFLKEKNCGIVIIGHKGRPEGKVDESLSIKPFQSIFDKWGARVEENLRFDPGEEANDPEFAKKLAGLGDVYINEAFASSHRAHASIVGIPELLPHAAGFHFIREVETLSKVFEDPKKPVITIVSGVKKDKLDYIKGLERVSDKVLIAGRLPEYIGEENLGEKVIVASLMQDKEDITINSIDKFKEVIKSAGTIVVAGPIGKYEEDGHRQGTKEVFEEIANSNAFKIAGGGDTEEAISVLGLKDKFDWISVGGGACLEFLINKTLPGIDALLR